MDVNRRNEELVLFQSTLPARGATFSHRKLR